MRCTAGSRPRLAAGCTSKHEIATLATTDSVVQLYKALELVPEVIGSNLDTVNYILFPDPQFSVLNQIPETLGFMVLRGCGQSIFIIYSLCKSISHTLCVM